MIPAISRIALSGLSSHLPERLTWKKCHVRVTSVNLYVASIKAYHRAAVNVSTLLGSTFFHGQSTGWFDTSTFSENFTCLCEKDEPFFREISNNRNDSFLNKDVCSAKTNFVEHTRM